VHGGGGGGQKGEAKKAITERQVAEFTQEWGALAQEEVSSADYYFNSYAHFGIHEEMLKDSVRTGTYQKAILQNAHLFRGKTVLDVGSGSGILSLFAAKAGAKKVYGIECSEIVEIARQIIAYNNYDDVVEFITGKAEEVTLPVDKVDIIVSEWMGYFLLYESMLDSVLFCRDKWLKEGGLIFPDKASLYLSGIEDADYREEKLGQWHNVYGFDFSPVKAIVMEDPLVDNVQAGVMNTTSCQILSLDLNTCKKDDADFASRFSIRALRRDFIHALVAWFDVTFSCRDVPHSHSVSFTTAPFSKWTHWKQTVFYLKDALVAHEGEEVSGLIAVRKNAKNPRDLDIKLKYVFDGAAAIAAVGGEGEREETENVVGGNEPNGAAGMDLEEEEGDQAGGEEAAAGKQKEKKNAAQRERGSGQGTGVNETLFFRLR